MKRRDSLVRKCVLGALLSSVAWAVPGIGTGGRPSGRRHRLPLSRYRIGGSTGLLKPAGVSSSTIRSEMARPISDNRAWPNFMNIAIYGQVHSPMSGCPPAAEMGSMRLTSAARISAMATKIIIATRRTAVGATSMTKVTISKRRRPVSITSISTGTKRPIFTALARRPSIREWERER